MHKEDDYNSLPVYLTVKEREQGTSKTLQKRLLDSPPFSALCINYAICGLSLKSGRVA